MDEIFVKIIITFLIKFRNLGKVTDISAESIYINGWNSENFYNPSNAISTSVLGKNKHNTVSDFGELMTAVFSRTVYLLHSYDKFTV